MEQWITGDEVRAAKQRMRDAIPGFVQPQAYSLARVDNDGYTFAHVNEVGGTHELPAVCLATVCGYANGNETFPMTYEQVAEAIALLAPAEPCTEFEHPNLWSWRPLLKSSKRYGEFVAVFIGDIEAEASTDAERALRELL